MSTKTTFKRVALATVAAMGFGLLSVVPANAAVATSTVSVASATISVNVGAPATTLVNLISSVASDTDTLTITPSLRSAPADSSMLITADDSDGTTDTAITTAAEFGMSIAGAAAPYSTLDTITNGVTTFTDPATNGVQLTATTTATAAGTFSAVPDVPGVYVFRLTVGSTTPSTVDITVRAGLSLDAARANRAFPLQGTNITSAWSGVDTGLVTARITGFSTDSTVRYYVTATGGVINSYTEREAIGALAANSLSGFAPTNAVNLSEGFFFDSASSEAGDAVDVQLNPTDGGTTASITVVSFNAVTGVSTTHVVATVSLGTAPAASAQYSTSIIAAGVAAAGATDALKVSLARTTGIRAANITVTVRDQNNNIMPTAGIAASITGPGLLSIETTDTVTASDTGAGRSVALTTTQAAGNNGIANVSVYADGTAGVATITITSGTVTLATETVTFFGSVATLEVTQNLKVARASASGAELGTSVGTGLAADVDTAAETPAVVIVAKDSNGNVVPNLTITGLSSNTAVIASTTVAQAVGTALTVGAEGPGTYLASVTSAVGGTSGATATVTFRTASPTTPGAFISATPLTFTLGGLIETETITFDKATYEPGEAMVVTRTAKDSAGNPVFDGNATPAITFNKAMGGSAIGASFYVGGVKATSATKPTVFAPVASGVFTARATSGNLAETALTATATVSDDAATTTASAAADAAAEATDAANAATDAANAAAEAADAATAAAQDAADAVAALSASVATMVSDLKKQITSLTNLVIKIQKKVRA
jgi:trimeric autotransporter adhesin